MNRKEGLNATMCFFRMICKLKLTNKKRVEYELWSAARKLVLVRKYADR